MDIVNDFDFDFDGHGTANMIEREGIRDVSIK